EQACKQQLASLRLVRRRGGKKFRDRFLGLLKGSPSRRHLLDQSADFRVVLPFVRRVAERRTRPYCGDRNFGGLGLGAWPVRVARICGEANLRRRDGQQCSDRDLPHVSPPAGPRRASPREGSYASIAPTMKTTVQPPTTASEIQFTLP